MSDRLSKRVSVLTAVFCLGLAAVAFRAGCLQLVPNPKLASISKQQSHREVEIPSTRGDIVDRHGKLLAGSVDVFSIYADPRSIDPNLARSYAERLAKVLDEPFSRLYRRLVSDRAFVWLSRQRPPRVRDAVNALKLAGVGIRREPKRYYPERDLASHVLGFTDVDGRGLEGIERRFDDVLAGAPKSVDVMRDALGHYLLFDQATRNTTVKGDTVRLTLDSAIQHATQSAIRDALTRYDAISATSVVLAVEDASVLAMAVEPHFNPNTLAGSHPADRRNRALTDIFEPGSTMKPLVTARALDERAVAQNAIIFCENGKLEIDGHTIRDAKDYGWLSLDTVVQKSSNIGATRIGQALGRERLGTLLGDLRFGKRSGIEFPGEVSGIVRPWKTWSEVGLANISFGHGVALTATQLAAAYRALAADGVYMKPRLVDAFIGTDEVVDVPESPSRRVFSRGATARVRHMLELAVGPEGTGPRARIDGYAVAGKTGTAQKIDPVSGGYSDESFVSVFAGFVPADDPAAVIVVMVDDPKPVHGGGKVAAPVFARIAAAVMRELGRVPDDSLMASSASVESAPEEPIGALSRGHEAALAAALAAARGGTPSYLGMTAKEAVERYARSGSRAALNMRGVGVVSEQRPRAGEPTEGQIELVLEAPGGSR